MWNLGRGIGILMLLCGGRGVVEAAEVGLDGSEAGGGRIPPQTVEYQVQVRDTETGQPVQGLVLRVNELRRVYRFGGPEECDGACTQQLESHGGQVITNAAGIGRMYFELEWCALESDDPVVWIREIHLQFEAPAVIENPASGVYSEWFLTRWEPGSSPIDQVVWVTHESILAERFAPVLHRHRMFEKQEDLADVEVSIFGHSTLSAYNAQGQEVYGPDRPPPLHLYQSWHWDACGAGSVPVWWVLDIDDDWKHRGEEFGFRPLYYHVFPRGDDVILQYWVWFNGNDPSEQWGVNAHEGDWEYLALRLRSEDGRWTPLQLNLSEHSGGRVLSAAEAWWSPGAQSAYDALQQGWDEGHDHPHVWLASNTHAFYNRFEPVFTIDTPFCGRWYDHVDYNLGGNPRGAHGLFRYDRLVNMEEFWRSQSAHGHVYLDHINGPIVALAFYGRYGTGSCTLPGGCPDELCEALGVLNGDVYQMAPRSPVISEEPHRWRDFVEGPERWGNGSSLIHFRAQPPVGGYLGEYRTRASGTADTVRFRIAAHRSDLPGVLRVEALSGNPRFLLADGGGEVALGAAVDGEYVVRQSMIEGAGEVRLDVYPAGRPGEKDAENLRADIVPAGAEPAVVESPGAKEDQGWVVCLAPNPTGRGTRIHFDRPSGRPRMVRVCDTTGREVWHDRIEAGNMGTTWDGVDMDGREVASGVYLVSVRDPGGASSRVKVVLAR